MSTKSPNDCEAITQTLHTYCRAVDDRDVDLLSSHVYAPDAVDVRREDRRHEGIEAIIAMFRSSWSTLEATFHQLSNVEVQLGPSGRTASAHSYVVAAHWMLSSGGAGTYRPADNLLAGGYVDRLELRDNGWRIVRRQPFKRGPGGLLIGTMPESFHGFGGVGKAAWQDHVD